MASDPNGRDRNGRFQKGTSGNPKGGKRGPRSRIMEHLRKQLSDTELAKVLADAARAAEPWAVTAILDRLAPKTSRLEQTFPDGIPTEREFRTPSEHRERLRDLLDEMPDDAKLN